MLIDYDERFLLELSLKIGIPIFELEEYPNSVINRYKALNIVSPFTDKAQSVRDGVLMSLVRNQNVTKRSNLVKAKDILPYLEEYPDYLEHPDIIKVKSLLKNTTQEWQVADIKAKVKEQIEIELGNKEPDRYLIHRLKELSK